MEKKFDLKKILTPENLKSFIKINLGAILVSIGVACFILPANLTTGGGAGFAIILSRVTGISMPVVFFVLNIFLTALGILTMGMSFGVMTIYTSFIIPIYIGIVQSITNLQAPLTDDMLVNLIFGTLPQSLGIVIALKNGASTGGTDIIGKIVEKYTHFSFGNGIMMCDGSITLASCFIFGPKIGMYAMLNVLINSTAIDKFIQGFDSKYQVTISSEKLNEINDFIINKLLRGCTLYQAKGGFSKKDKEILSTIVTRKQYIRLTSFIKETDPKAFMVVNKVNEAFGEGFTYYTINVEARKKGL